MDPQGTDLGLGPSGASELTAFWKGFFAYKEADEEQWAPFLAKVILAPSDSCWKICFEEFVTLVQGMKDSGTGPDGLPYSAFAKGGHAVLVILWNAFERAMDGRSAEKQLCLEGA